MFPTNNLPSERLKLKISISLQAFISTVHLKGRVQNYPQAILSILLSLPSTPGSFCQCLLIFLFLEMKEDWERDLMTMYNSF